MAFLIDTIDSSGLFAQSANSATIATKDSNGNDITATYQPSGDYYSASNPSGFMTELPASATDAISAVTTYSGSWGGSALPISAGPGIKVNLVNNTLVFSNDETMLWSGTKNSIGETIQLSESLNNFNKIAILHCDRYAIDGSVSYFERTASGDFEWLTFPCVSQFMFSNTVYNRGSELSANANKDVLTIVGSFNYAVNTAGPYGYSIITADSALGQRNIYKVVGINRVSGGN